MGEFVAPWHDEKVSCLIQDPAVHSPKLIFFFWGGGSMATHKKPAHEAGKLLGNKKTPKPAKRVAASDLSQAKKKPKK
jgi:hypothetical protein